MTLFDFMDDFSLLNIFDFLEFGDLANIATLGQRYEQLVAHHYFAPKYGLVESFAHISLSNFDTETRATYTNANKPHSPNLYTIGYDRLFSVLKVFCSKFSHITIATNYILHNIDATRKVANTINDYCPNTPQTIKMDLPPSTVNLNFTFNNATDINIHFAGYPAHYGHEIERIFPHMTSLSIDIHAGYNLNHYFPHLKGVSVREDNNGQFNWKTFARRNPQIRSVRLKFDWDIEHLEQINHIFPILESLHIDLKFRKEERKDGLVANVSKWWNAFNAKPLESIHFKNVKHFTMDISYYHNERLLDGASSIQFDRLESFKLITRSDQFIEEAIDVITQNAELKRVDVGSHILTAAQTVRLVNGLPKLEEITLKCSRDTQVDDLLGRLNGFNVGTVILCFGRDMNDTRAISSPDGWQQLQRRSEMERSLAFVRV